MTEWMNEDKPQRQGGCDHCVTNTGASKNSSKIPQQTKEANFKWKNQKPQTHTQRRLSLPSDYGYEIRTQERHAGDTLRNETETAQATWRHDPSKITSVSWKVANNICALSDLVWKGPARHKERQVYTCPEHDKNTEYWDYHIPLFVVTNHDGMHCQEHQFCSQDTNQDESTKSWSCCKKPAPSLKDCEPDKVPVNDWFEWQPANKAEEGVAVQRDVKKPKEADVCKEHDKNNIEKTKKWLKPHRYYRKKQASDEKRDSNKVLTNDKRSNYDSNHFKEICPRDEAELEDGDVEQARDETPKTPNANTRDEQPVCDFLRCSYETIVENGRFSEHDDPKQATDPESKQTEADRLQREIVDKSKGQAEHKETQKCDEKNCNIIAVQPASVQSQAESHKKQNARNIA